MFSPLPSTLFNVAGTIYFSADNGINGRELWKTDGTVAGTQMVLDLNLIGDSIPTTFATR